MLVRLLILIIRYRLAVYVLACLLLVVASVATSRLPIDALPNLSENQVLVYSRWPDHLPGEIYERVTRPLATSLKEIEGARSIRGSSDVGFSLIYVLFDDTTPLDSARRRVIEHLNAQKFDLPEGMTPQVAPAAIATGQILWYTLHGRNTDLLELRRWQDQVIAPKLRLVPGVAEVASVGGFEPELNIDLSAQALAERGLSLGTTWQQISQIQAIRPADTPKAIESEPGRLNLTVEQIADHPLVSDRAVAVRLGDVAKVTLGPAPRYGSFEQDGTELVAGVVHMQPDGNTLAVTDAVLKELRRVQRELPNGWACLPCYDRRTLIESAVRTVTRTLLEALLVTTISIVVVMRHWRASLVIALTLPLAVLSALLGMACLPSLGQPMNANIMSLAGIAVSVGLLVDAAVVMVENVNHRLHAQFGEQVVAGDTTDLVARASAQVARPAAMAILIMLISFAPLFVLGGLDGQMLRPLLWTKSFTLVAVLVSALTLVPCLSRDLLRGHIQGEDASRLIRGLRQVYEPLLKYCFHSLGPLICLLGCLGVLACAAIGSAEASRWAVVVSVAVSWLALKRLRTRLLATVALVIIGLAAPSVIRPLSLALRIPLDEGMVMDMPITLPRTNMLQATDDLKARNMLLCRFPEIAMVSGKVGRAETAFDPAPIDMIETMVEFRKREYWPRRRLNAIAAREQSIWLLDQLVQQELLDAPTDRQALIDDAFDSCMLRFDAISREVSWQHIRELENQLRDQLMTHLASSFLAQLTSSTSTDQGQWGSWLIHHVPIDLQLAMTRQLNINSIDSVVRHLQAAAAAGDSPLAQIKQRELDAESLLPQWFASLNAIYHRAWSSSTHALNASLERRAAPTWNQIVLDELFQRVAIRDDSLRNKVTQAFAARYRGLDQTSSHHGEGHAGLPGTSDLPWIDPHPTFDRLLQAANLRFGSQLWLWSHTSATLSAPDGEMDRAVTMPGWANVWTRPIQNRIDMLTTGVNAEVGIRVLGDDLPTVAQVSEQIASVVRMVGGATGVIADPIRGKDYAEFVMDSARVERAQLDAAEARLSSRAATVGLTRNLTIASAQDAPPIALRVTLQQPTLMHSLDPTVGTAVQSDSLGATLLPIKIQTGPDAAPAVEDANSVKLVTLDSIGTVAHFDGPSTIKSTNGRLSNYVRLNVVGRSAIDWVQEAKQRLAGQEWPQGIDIEWTGQFEHALRTQSTMRWLIPCCVCLIVMAIYMTFRDIADTALILLTLPGAMIGAVLAQWALQLPVSLNVVVGYISCLGMAAATGMVMIVYLRDAVGTTNSLSTFGTLVDLEAAVVRGAVHRLRPKLLTEVAMIVSLVPLIWSDGAGADVIRPMAAPVLGGILIADEVVDLLLPSLFYRIRRRRWMRLKPLQQNHSHAH